MLECDFCHTWYPNNFMDIFKWVDGKNYIICKDCSRYTTSFWEIYIKNRRNNMKKVKSMCLCEGRHEIPQAIDGAIFPMELDPLNIKAIDASCAEALADVKELTLYVTGLTVALVSVINYCHNNNVDLTLMHYDRNTGGYYAQKVF